MSSRISDNVGRQNAADAGGTEVLLRQPQVSEATALLLQLRSDTMAERKIPRGAGHSHPSWMCSNGASLSSSLLSGTDGDNFCCSCISPLLLCLAMRLLLLLLWLLDDVSSSNVDTELWECCIFCGERRGALDGAQEA